MPGPDKNAQYSLQPLTPRTPSETPAQTFDYFGMKLKGADDPAINQALESQNADVNMLDPKQAYQKYGQSGAQQKLWKDEKGFNDYYANTTKQYNDFKKAREIYKRTQQDASEGTQLGAFGLSTKVQTQQQVAWDKGFYIDDEDGGKKKPLSDKGTFDTMEVISDESGSPVAHKVSIFDRLNSSQTISWLGPETMHSGWTSKLLNGMASAVEDIPSYAGGLVRMSVDAATSIMNAFEGKGFKSDSELADKWSQPGYTKFANLLENISTGAKNQSEDYTNSTLYGLTNMITQIGAIALTGGVAGAADGALGLGEESAINLSKAATHTAIAGMVAEPFLKECHDIGVPDGKAALMAMGVVAATSFVSHKIGTDAVWNTFSKMMGDGTLKKGLQEGIEREMSAAGITEMDKIPASGWKKIVTDLTGKLASGSEKGAAIKNTFNAAIKGGLGMTDFTLTQNAAKTAWDTYSKRTNPEAQQGKGLFYKRESSVAGNLTEGLGSSFMMGFMGTGLFSGAENALLESQNKGFNSELRNRYMEKEIANGRYDDMVKFIMKESKKGSWGMGYIGEDGQAIKAGEQKRSMNDVNTDNLLKQASLIKDIYDKKLGDSLIL